MEYDVNRLVKLVASNGFEITLAHLDGVSVVSILHHHTSRESVFGFDMLTKQDALRSIAEQFCTEPQRMLMNEVRESKFQYFGSGRLLIG